VSSRPRLLFLCQTVPYPPDGGVWIRTYHVLRLLAREFDITALCFERPRMDALGGVEAIRKALEPFARVEVFAVPQWHSRLRYAYDHVRSTAFRRVYTSYQYDSGAFRRRLARVLDDLAFDLVHIDSLDLANYVPSCGDRPVVCVHHDVQ
jgi:polysaccharide biosynthesis protein PslH